MNRKSDILEFSITFNGRRSLPNSVLLSDVLLFRGFYKFLLSAPLIAYNKNQAEGKAQFVTAV